MKTLHSMKTRLTLRPGMRGTKRMCQKYGPRLLAVRYIYDERGRRRLKTVELVEEVMPWNPPHAVRGITVVAVRTGPEDGHIDQVLLKAGASWDAWRGCWELDYATVVNLGLKDRIVRETMGMYAVVRIPNMLSRKYA